MKNKNGIYLLSVIFWALFGVAEKAMCAPEPTIETIVAQEIENVQKWTPANSPYIIKDTVTVGENASITVYPGTVVLFEKGAVLVIKGAFYANGLPTKPVQFLPKDGEAFYQGIQLEGKYTNQIEFAIMVRGGIVIKDSRLLLNNNYILNSTGVEIFPFSEVTIKDNYFYNNTYGVYTEAEDANYALIGNTFVNNRFAVYIKKTLKQRIDGNNFEGNGLNFTNYSTIDIGAQNNYWGTGDEATINKLIFDKTKNPQVGLVNYKPFVAEHLNTWQPPEVFTAQVKKFLTQKKPEAEVSRVGFGAGAMALIPMSPNYLGENSGLSKGFFAEFNINLNSWLLIGVEGNVGTLGNKNKVLYDYSMEFSQLLLDLSAYIGYKKNSLLLPYAKVGSGLGIISEKYKYPAGNTLKINDTYAAGLAGVGIEWCVLQYMSAKAELAYNCIASKRGLVSWPLLSISAIIYFDLPLFLSADGSK